MREINCDEFLGTELMEEASRRFPRIFESREISSVRILAPDLLKVTYADDGSWVLYDDVFKSIRYISTQKANQVRKGRLHPVAWLYSFSILFNRALSKHGVTQREVSERSGLSERIVSEYSNGATVPSIYKLYRLVNAIGCSPEELINVDLYYYGIEKDI